MLYVESLLSLLFLVLKVVIACLVIYFVTLLVFHFRAVSRLNFYEK